MEETLLKNTNQALKALKRGQWLRISAILFLLAITTIISLIFFPDVTILLDYSPFLILGFWIGGMITAFIGMVVFMNRSQKAYRVVVENLYGPLFDAYAKRQSNWLELKASDELIDPPSFILRQQQARVFFTIGYAQQAPLLQAIEIRYMRSTGTRSSSYLEFGGYYLKKTTKVPNFSVRPEANGFGIPSRIKEETLSQLPEKLIPLVQPFHPSYPYVYAENLAGTVEVGFYTLPFLRLRRRYGTKHLTEVQKDIERLFAIVTAFDEQF